MVIRLLPVPAVPYVPPPEPQKRLKKFKQSLGLVVGAANFSIFLRGLVSFTQLCRCWLVLACNNGDDQVDQNED